MRKLALFSRYRLYRGRGEFSPADFFLGGITGVWYDPSDVVLNWRTNLLTWSQTFSNSVWTKQTGTTVTGVFVTAPDGTLTGQQIDWTTTSVGQGILQAGMSVSGSYSNTKSIYVRADVAGGTVELADPNNTVSTPTFTLTTSWQRISLTEIQPAGTAGIWLRKTASSPSTIYIWGAQLEINDSATAYQAITTPEQTYLTYDPQPVLYQDAVGTTPVFAIEQPVGLMLDKSQGLVLGSELVTNGDFSGGTTGWTNSSTGTGTFAVSGGVATITGTDASNRGVFGQGFTTVVGRAYVLTFTASGVSGATLFGASTSPGYSFSLASGAITAGATRFQFVATTTTTYVNFAAALSTTGAASLDNISVKEIAGNHAVQSTNNAFRPTLKARYNQLTYSEQFNNAAWTKTASFVQANLLIWSQEFNNTSSWATVNATITANTGVAPDSTVTADTLTSNGSATIQRVTQSNSQIGLVTFSVYAKAGTAQFLQILHASDANCYANFDLSTGTTGTFGTGSTSTITNVGSGWYRCTLSFTLSIASNWQIYIAPSASASYGQVFTATVASLSLWGAQLVQGSVAGDYRATLSAALPVLYTSPIGTLTANKLCEIASAAPHGAYQAYTYASGVTQYISVYAKQGERSWMYIGADTAAAEAVFFDLANGVIGNQGSGYYGYIENLGSGWYRCSVSINQTIAVPPNYYVIGTTTANGTTSYTGDGSSGIYIWGAQLVTLADNDLIDGQYQRIAAATDYNTDPALFPVYLDFDGSNDFMVSNSINFTSTDKVTVWAGVGKDTDAAVGIPLELSVNHVANAGSFAVYAAASALPNYEFRLTGTTNVYQTASSYTAPCYNVLSCLYDINGADTASEIYPQVDGTVPFLTAGGAANAGTGNFGTYPLYLGSRAGSSFYFNGKLFGLIVRGAASTSTEIYQGELWMAGKEDLTLYPDAAFNPLSLFAGGAPGAWYKPSDFYNYMSQLGPELVTNGDFSAGATGWTLVGAGVSITGGQLVFNAAGATQYALQTVLTVGRWYSITYTVSGYSAGAVRVAAGGTNGVSRTSNGTFTEYLLCTADGGFYVITASGSNTFNIDNVSVQALTGTFSMYQESTGVTPVTAVEQSVGLILDQSKGLTIGPELVTNGDFASATGWTTGGGWVISGGVASLTAATAILSQSTTTGVAGRWYQVTFTIVSLTSGTLRVEFGGANGVTRSTAGTYTQYLLATSTGPLLIQPLSTLTATIDNVSVKEVPGNHAFQSTPANCPILRARYNLLTYSEQFDNAVWQKSTSTVTANTVTAPDGTTTADTLVLTSGGGVSQLYQSTSVINGTVTVSVWLRADAPVTLDFGFYDSTGDVASINVTTEWQRFTRTRTAGLTSVDRRACWLYKGSAGGATVYIWGAQLSYGSSAGTYQRIAAATDYATGSAFPVYLAFDGSNDSLATNSIDFSATNKMFACASVTKLSDAAVGALAELSASFTANAGTFYLAAPETTGASGDFSINGRGSATQLPVFSGTILAPATRVFTALFDIAAPARTLRLNGAQVATNSGGIGTGNFGNYPLYIGARAGTSIYFNGRIFDLLVCGALVDYTDVANTEYYMAGEAGLPRTLTYDYVTLDDGDQITTDSGDPIYDQITFT